MRNGPLGDPPPTSPSRSPAQPACGGGTCDSRSRRGVMISARLAYEGELLSTRSRQTVKSSVAIAASSRESCDPGWAGEAQTRPAAAPRACSAAVMADSSAPADQQAVVYGAVGRQRSGAADFCFSSSRRGQRKACVHKPDAAQGVPHHHVRGGDRVALDRPAPADEETRDSPDSIRRPCPHRGPLRERDCWEQNLVVTARLDRAPATVRHQGTRSRGRGRVRVRNARYRSADGRRTRRPSDRVLRTEC